jgi:hypothetical protein
MHFKTTELLVTVLTDIGIVAAALTSNLSPRYAAIAAAVSTSAYALSRGIAKQGNVPGPPVKTTTTTVVTPPPTVQ